MTVDLDALEKLTPLSHFLPQSLASARTAMADSAIDLHPDEIRARELAHDLEDDRADIQAAILEVLTRIDNHFASLPEAGHAERARLSKRIAQIAMHEIIKERGVYYPGYFFGVYFDAGAPE